MIQSCRRVVATLTIACLLAAALPVQAEAIDLTRYRGKVVVVDFWASWCAPCRQSFPWLNAMQSKYGRDGLVVIGVNVDRVRAEADRFLRDVPATFEIAYDPDGSLATQYDVPGMPTSYVFDTSGKLVGKHVGFRNASRTEREAEIQKLLGVAHSVAAER